MRSITVELCTSNDVVFLVYAYIDCTVASTSQFLWKCSRCEAGWGNLSDRDVKGEREGIEQCCNRCGGWTSWRKYRQLGYRGEVLREGLDPKLPGGTMVGGP